MQKAFHDFVPYSKFVRDLESAKQEDYLAIIKNGLVRLSPHTMHDARTGVLRNQAAAEFRKIKDFLHSRYQHAHAVHTYLDTTGHHVDCIPIGQHPAVIAAKKAGYRINFNHAPPAPLKGMQHEQRTAAGTTVKASGSVFHPGETDEYGNEKVCPEGCVPVRRLTLARMASLGTFQRFFRKSKASPYSAPAKVKSAPGKASKGRHRFAPDSREAAPLAAPDVAQLGVDGYLHRHAIATTSDASGFTGAATFLNVWSPQYTPGEMSLSQLWIRRDPAEGFLQTIESGWTVHPARTHNFGPTLFVYVNPDNYNQPDPPGGSSDYNIGFIPNPGATIVTDMPLPSISEADGRQVVLVLQWQLDPNGDWVLFSAGENPGDDMQKVGHIPGDVYRARGGDAPWTRADFGGEVANTKGDPRTGAMGSGEFPTSPVETGFKKVAFQMDITVQKEVGGPHEKADLQAVPTADDDQYYKLIVGEGSEAGATIYFGGPGNG